MPRNPFRLGIDPFVAARTMRGRRSTSSRQSVARLMVERLEARHLLATFTVDSVLDLGDSVAGDGVCDDGSGNCTLRAALEESNGLLGTDQIHFGVAGDGPHTIEPGSPLPLVTEPTVIDGRTQAGTTFSGSGIRSVASLNLQIVLDGSGAGGSTDGLQLAAPSSVLGLVIHSFDGAGISIVSAGNVIEGNIIGTDPMGQTLLGNAVGVSVVEQPNNIIGSPEGLGNLLSGNRGAGVAVTGNGASGTVIQGNQIGTDRGGTAPVGNGAAGVLLSEGVTGSRIGGMVPGSGNTIAFNGDSGVVLSEFAGAGNAILANSLFDNLALGIDLGADGVTPNDPDDADAGPNQLQNFPTLSVAEVDSSGSLSLSYSVASAISAAAFPLRVEFFKADSEGNGEGKTLLATDEYTAASAQSTKSVALGEVGVAAGDLIVATATDAVGNTSEFSGAVTVMSEQLDWGDLPDTSDGLGAADYQTLLARGGPSHVILSTLLIGAGVDAEADGQPTFAADGDDLGGGLDDEDGVALPSTITAGEPTDFLVTFTNQTGTDATLYGFVDWNNDGEFTGSNEALMLTVGEGSDLIANLGFDVPGTAVVGADLGARFRLSIDSTLTANGPAPNGEVEDYVVRVQARPQLTLTVADAAITENGGTTTATVARNDTNGELIVNLTSSDTSEATVVATAVIPDGQTTSPPFVINAVDDALLDGIQTVTLTASAAGFTSGTAVLNVTDFEQLVVNLASDTMTENGGATTATVSRTDPTGNLTILLVSSDTSEATVLASIVIPDTQLTSPVFTINAVDDIVIDGTQTVTITASALGYVSGTNSLDVTDFELDFGDAPDPSFFTRLASGGARHEIGALFLGDLVDAEEDGQPDFDATGDDLSGAAPDDEDGVILPSPLFTGETTSVSVIASASGGLLNAWIDFNDNGSWADSGEQVFTDQLLEPGVNDLSFTVPAEIARSTGTFARFRLSTEAGLSFDGPARDGEVEDYEVSIEKVDFGDAPDPTYPTLLANDGARHGFSIPVVALGLSFSVEPDGQPNATATGDDDDGVRFTSPLIAGLPATMRVVAGGAPGLLNAWIDFDNNGIWTPSEQVFSDTALSTGNNTLSFDIPDSAPGGTTFARFRIDSGGGLQPTGLAMDGEVEDYQVEVFRQLDFGDAPDSLFPTLRASNGARHQISSLFLGAALDAEADGQPSALADADDLMGLDDEDGVQLSSSLFTGETATVDVTASMAGGLLNGWVDFNGNGSWGDSGEQIFGDRPLEAGLNRLSFPVPATAIPTDLAFARFRVASQAGLSFVGLASDGEVEDYPIAIHGVDFGDAPDPSYPTLRTNNGARHGVTDGPRLGNRLDIEVDGQPSLAAQGDDLLAGDDEDGVTFTSPLIAGLTATVDVHVTSAAGLLNSWIDFDGDGSWTNNEQIFSDRPLEVGTHSLSFDVPTAVTAGSTFSRFRIDTAGGLQPSGFALDGEVEDHQVVLRHPTTTATMEPTQSFSTGFVAQFNAPIDPDILNLYDTSNAGLGPADVTVRGAESGLVNGSLLVDPSNTSVTFIKAGGPLDPDDYTVTLRSGNDAFRSALGSLDGNGDGEPGDDFVGVFTVETPTDDAVTIEIPDFVRGPGQAIHVPADRLAGIPVSISDGAGIRSIRLELIYDPALLDITNVRGGDTLPDGTQVELETSTPGRLLLTVTSPVALLPGPVTVAHLEGSVPTNDIDENYGRSQILRINQGTITAADGEVLPAILDDGLHLVSYFGDVSGNRRINAGDATQVARVAALLDAGFASTLRIDPGTIADISGNRRVNAVDASLVAQFAALIDVPSIPPIPTAGKASARTIQEVQSDPAQDAPRGFAPHFDRQPLPATSTAGRSPRLELPMGGQASYPPARAMEVSEINVHDRVEPRSQLTLVDAIDQIFTNELIVERSTEDGGDAARRK